MSHLYNCPLWTPLTSVAKEVEIMTLEDTTITQWYPKLVTAMLVTGNFVQSHDSLQTVFTGFGAFLPCFPHLGGKGRGPKPPGPLPAIALPPLFPLPHFPTDMMSDIPYPCQNIGHYANRSGQSVH